jgi:hypothetical protein
MYRTSQCTSPHNGQTLCQFRTDRASKASAPGSGKRFQKRGAQAFDSEAKASTVYISESRASRTAPASAMSCCTLLLKTAIALARSADMLQTLPTSSCKMPKSFSYHDIYTFDSKDCQLRIKRIVSAIARMFFVTMHDDKTKRVDPSYNNEPLIVRTVAYELRHVDGVKLTVILRLDPERKQSIMHTLQDSRVPCVPACHILHSHGPYTPESWQANFEFLNKSCKSQMFNRAHA